MKQTQLYAHQLSGHINKRYFCYDRYDYPVKILECSTYKTGKHGHAKTTLKMEDLFTENIVSDIVQSDYVFQNADSSTSYVSKADAEITCLYQEKPNAEIYADLIAYTENFDVLTYSKVKLHSSCVKELQKYLDRKDLKLSSVLNTETLDSRLTTNLVEWNLKNTSKKICLNLYLEKL